MRACLEVSWLSVLELCEISQKNSVDADGNPVEVLNCAKNSEKISVHSLNVCKFETPLWLGQLLILRSKVIYVDPKKGKVYVQVTENTVDPEADYSQLIKEDKPLESDDDSFQVTFAVSKDIQLKPIMP